MVSLKTPAAHLARTCWLKMVASASPSSSMRTLYLASGRRLTSGRRTGCWSWPGSLPGWRGQLSARLLTVLIGTVAGCFRGRLSRYGQVAAQRLRWRPAWCPLGWVLVVVGADGACLTRGTRSFSCCRHGHGHGHLHRPVADSSGGRLAVVRAAPSASLSASSPECDFGSSRRLGSTRDFSARGTVPAAGLVDGGTRRGGGRACGPHTCGPAHSGTSVSRMRRVAVSGSSVSR